MISATDLREYVGAGTVDEAFAAECVATADALVSAFVGSAEIPAEIRDRAVLEVGSELFHRRQAPNGIAQFAAADGTPGVRVARDPMVAARPILAPFVPLGFA